MSDPRIDRLAEILVRYSTGVRPGDLVGITGIPFSPEALPLMEAVAREILRAGGHPLPRLENRYTEGFDTILYGEGSDDQLTFLEPWAEQTVRSLDCDIKIKAATNTRGLSTVDSSRIALHRRSRAELFNLYLRRAAEGSLRWALCLTPTAAYAQDAEMSLSEFADLVYSGTYADQDDPIAAWKHMSETQAVIVEKLGGKSTVAVQSPNVDLTFSIEGRTFVNCDGKRNMPDGEIFTTPVEESINGWMESSFPAIHLGVDVGRVRLRFENGRVVEAEAEKHQEYLSAMLDSDEGARHVGEFGIGMNDRIRIFTKNMLFDEKIAGTVHLALGASYPETGGVNRSAIHWDFLCDMREGGTITMDGIRVYESGKFTV
ncbi:MAG: aminopeptidase [Spirochaetales bacterium]|nr:aminopeptidase [Spirochaetales bacterium]